MKSHAGMANKTMPHPGVGGRAVAAVSLSSQFLPNKKADQDFRNFFSRGSGKLFCEIYCFIFARILVVLVCF